MRVIASVNDGFARELVTPHMRGLSGLITANSDDVMTYIAADEALNRRWWSGLWPLHAGAALGRRLLVRC